jgi:hypothetical protein
VKVFFLILVRTFCVLVCVSVIHVKYATAKIDATLFNSDDNFVLAIDLRDETKIEMGLIIKDEKRNAPEQKIFLLPFTTTNSQGNDYLYSTWGPYHDITLVTCILPGASEHLYEIGLTPLIKTSLDEGVGLPQSNDPILLLHRAQLRIFAFRYYGSRTTRDPIINFIESSSQRIQSIAVALPEGAIPAGVTKGQTSNPPAKFFNDRDVAFYPADVTGGIERLEIRYFIQPTEPQKLLVEFYLSFCVIGGTASDARYRESNRDRCAESEVAYNRWISAPRNSNCGLFLLVSSVVRCNDDI